jgi:hypothetical protein
LTTGGVGLCCAANGVDQHVIEVAMPLSPPAEREHLHLRRVECRGYRRQDGLWDIEGYLHDSKTYGFDNRFRGRIEPGVPVHEMWVRLTIDDGMRVQAIETATEAGPFAICGDIAPNYQRLIGERIGPGWTRRVKELLGGVAGCTHLMELLFPIATTAYQTMASRRQKERESGDRPKNRPWVLDTCHAWRADGPVVKEFFPEFYKGT